MNKKEILRQVEREMRDAVSIKNPFSYSAYDMLQNIEDLWKEDYANNKNL